MSSASPPTPRERLALLVRYLCEAVGGQGLGLRPGVRLPVPLMLLLTGRLKTIRDRFKNLVARIVAGTYVPRRYARRRAAIAPTRPRETPLRQEFGWLSEILPDAAQYRAHLHDLLQDPELLALVAAAPAPIARLLRPLCWMLKLKPPAILANPRRPAGTPPPAPAPYRPPPRPPAPPRAAPANTLGIGLLQFGIKALPKPA